jgi:uncharacterized protein YigA (DUF484 family)
MSFVDLMMLLARTGRLICSHYRTPQAAHLRRDFNLSCVAIALRSASDAPAALAVTREAADPVAAKVSASVYLPFL